MARSITTVQVDERGRFIESLRAGSPIPPSMMGRAPEPEPTGVE